MIWHAPKKNVQIPSLNHSAPIASSQQCNYDVFLSFRGEDIRKTFVDHLYSALRDRQIQTYKDDETLPQGESIGPSLFKAIEESRIAVIIFSKNYANSSWCLEELAYIMKCRYERGLIVMPIFYDVEPLEVRKLKGDFGKAFAKQEVEHIVKAESWRKALVDASKIGGWEPKNIANGHESKVIKDIVDTILDRLFPFNSHVDEDLVGMATRLQDLKSRLEIGSGGVRMVGIWGVGGGGKSTLAGKSKDDAMEILEACDFHPEIGIKVLRQKALIRIVGGRFDMHDLVQEMGHYIVREEHPANPENHSRVWKHEEISNMFFEDAKMVKLHENDKIEAITYNGYSHGHNLSSRFCLEIPKGFKPPLLRGSRCRLQLPENWCNDFCGFLMCAILPKKYSWNWIFYMMHESLRISINHAMSGMDSQDDVVWEESDSDGDKYTWVGYVSFGSLRHTTWWDQTYKALTFGIEGKFDKFCGGFGVRLVAKKNRSGLTETSSDSCGYMPNFEIEHDSGCVLTISFPTFI
ncbi:hypothetical protein L1987_30860 [Smallanthus sonchifolius]|uniref:Uncharacterized protein n=1 Tax=Smallanthus sonchifolius TaxID=185202 RepID=A0ACB9I3D9_9ASTR|nr:hypothetical protein L1987_30860 [Smallanthus sonchifolius]